MVGTLDTVSDFFKIENPKQPHGYFIEFVGPETWD